MLEDKTVKHESILSASIRESELQELEKLLSINLKKRINKKLNPMLYLIRIYHYHWDKNTKKVKHEYIQSKSVNEKSYKKSKHSFLKNK